jgi:hypothetical protein
VLDYEAHELESGLNYLQLNFELLESFYCSEHIDFLQCACPWPVSENTGGRESLCPLGVPCGKTCQSATTAPPSPQKRNTAGSLPRRKGKERIHK